MQSFPDRPILLVDDERRSLDGFALALASRGVTNTRRCQDPCEVLGLLAAEEHAAVLLDLVMPGLSGEQLLEAVSLEHPGLPVVMVTGLDDVETAVRCLRRGAVDYIVKPVDPDRLWAGVNRALENGRLRRENRELARGLLGGDLRLPEAFSGIVTSDEKMLAVFRYVEAVAGGGEPVLVTGETGTGKELVARALHEASGRAGAFVAVNAAGLDDQVFSDTLFGHVRGAFTGADRERAGFIEKAAGGTLFLDEIGDLAEASQIRLLRVLQEREYHPLGSDASKALTARIVVATLKDADELAASPTFRRDLYYRLRTHHVHLPPLRERSKDIPLLLDHFLETAAADFGKKRPTPPRELATLLGGYGFPGNVRELRSMVYDAVGRHESRMLSCEVFLERMGEAAPVASGSETDQGLFAATDHLPTIREATDALVHEALARCGGNQRAAAAQLGISRQALSKRLQKLNR